MAPCSWFSELFRQSILGIADDVSYAMRPWKEQLVSLNMTVRWFHGEMDEWSPYDMAQEIGASYDNVQIEPIQRGGHLIYASHPEEVWQGISNFVHARNR